MTVNAFATGLEHPRWLHVLPNGDVLVAETNAPPKPEDAKGVRGWIIEAADGEGGRRRSRAPTASRCCATPTATASPRRARRSSKACIRRSAWRWSDGDFYVANTDAVVRFPYAGGRDAHRRAAGTKLVDLPAGPLNHHWTKSLIASRDGTKLYATVGSNSNVAEHGMEVEEGRAAIWEIDRKTGAHRVFASGLRNPNGMAWEPETGALWTAVNERDELGSDLVPDYLTSVKDGGFYGWPYSYFGAARRRAREAAAAGPGGDGDRARLRARRAHRVAGPGASRAATRCRRRSRSGMFVGQHGSWNRKPPSGYQVIFVPFAGGKPAGQPVDGADRLPRARRRGATAGRSAWRSTAGARCWSPTTSATRSGGRPRRRARRPRCHVDVKSRAPCE